jgi:phosphoglycolate phosphatase-like HAD superfamily hydrolase
MENKKNSCSFCCTGNEYRFLYQVWEIPSISYCLEGINQVGCWAVPCTKSPTGENIERKNLFMALIIFDFDGVLANTLDDLIQIGQEVCNELGVKHVVKRDDLSNLEIMSFASFGRACEVPEHLVDEFVQRCLKRFAERKSPPAIFNGLSTIVRNLAINNTLAIITTNSSQNVNAFLIEHGLDKCIHAVYGVDIPGSKAQKIAIARNQFSAATKRESVFMIGDSLSDIRAAKEASVTSIAVTWGHQSLEYLLRGDPDYVVNFPDDLAEIIEK